MNFIFPLGGKFIDLEVYVRSILDRSISKVSFESYIKVDLEVIERRRILGVRRGDCRAMCGGCF